MCVPFYRISLNTESLIPTFLNTRRAKKEQAQKESSRHHVHTYFFPERARREKKLWISKTPMAYSYFSRVADRSRLSIKLPGHSHAHGQRLATWPQPGGRKDAKSIKPGKHGLNSTLAPKLYNRNTLKSGPQLATDRWY